MAPVSDKSKCLKEWLVQAWRYLAQPSLTRFQRQEMRNRMSLADAKLRAGLQKIACRDKLIRRRGTAFEQIGRMGEAVKPEIIIPARRWPRRAMTDRWKN
jgi:hypothetical protein